MAKKIDRRWVTAAFICSVATTLISCQTTQPTTTADNASAPELPAPPPPPANAYLSQLPPEATNQLTELEIEIAIPTYLPAKMTLANYGVATSAPHYYWLVYRDDQNRCFAIEYTATRGDDLSLENQEVLENALLGEGYNLYHGKFPNGGAAELPESDLFTDWIEGKTGFYRLVGAGLVNSQDYGQKDCSNLTIKEAIAVAESLSYLPTDIRTLDLTPQTAD